jgi:glycosyltransferase involved in cell wall biosynthesis
VYLQQHSWLFRKTPRFLDRLWDSPAVIGAFAGRGVSADARLLGDMTISMLQGEHGVLRKEFEKLVEWARDEPAPDVVNLPNSLLIAMALPLKQALGRPVFVTLQGEELFIDGLEPHYRDRALALIRAHVAHVDRFIAVSEYCAAFMMRYLDIPSERIAVVPLGIDMSGYEKRRASDGAFRVGYFARVAPEKGLKQLADAYVRFRAKAGQASARLEAAGYMAPRHRAYLEDVRQQISRAGLGDEFAYRGSVDRAGKLQFLRDLDVLSVPATYDEPKGVFLLEAMASGVPVLQPRRGAFIEVVEKTGGGCLVPPDDPEALAEGLYALWSDRDRTASLGDRAFHGVRTHYTIAQSADRLLETYSTAGAPAAG